MHIGLRFALKAAVNSTVMHSSATHGTISFVETHIRILAYDILVYVKGTLYNICIKIQQWLR